VTAVALSPLAGAFAAQVVASAPSPQVTGTQSGGGSSSNTALGLAALIGAAGVAVLRARQLSAATGIADIGTLTALGHSASTFWAGSCVSLGTGSTATAATVNASLPSDQLSPATAVGNRAQFGVRSALSGVGATAGGRAQQPVATIHDPAGEDRTGLAAILFALSAIIGAALGAVGPRRQGA
jgi:hypothetical protein